MVSRRIGTLLRAVYFLCPPNSFEPTMLTGQTASNSESPQPFRLDGRHALVTGGASGIGAATVKELVRAGAQVWIADLNREAAEALAATLPEAQPLALDVTSPSSIEAAVAKLSRLDILVNNAGVGHVGTIETTEREDFDRILDVNIRAVYMVTRALMPILLASQQREQNGGRAAAIVNIASVAGLVGVKQRFAYCTSKGAIIAMTRQLAVDYPKTLRVNAICPGTVETPFVEGYLDKFHAHNKEETRAELRARQPVGRLGRPEEIASMVRYLASDEAAFVSGSILTIDGGWTAA